MGYVVFIMSCLVAVSLIGSIGLTILLFSLGAPLLAATVASIVWGGVVGYVGARYLL